MIRHKFIDFNHDITAHSHTPYRAYEVGDMVEYSDLVCKVIEVRFDHYRIEPEHGRCTYVVSAGQVKVTRRSKVGLI